MYLLIEGDKPKTHEIIYCQLNSGKTQHIEENNSESWKLIGITPDDDDIPIATFRSEDHAYKALRQLLDMITTDVVEWDVVEFKKYLESDVQDNSDTLQSTYPIIEPDNVRE